MALVGEVVGGVGAEPADVGAQVRRQRAELVGSDEEFEALRASLLRLLTELKDQ